MRTLLVSGNDTGIGKTRVLTTLARYLSAGGARVQIVKVIETGIHPNDSGDADNALKMARSEKDQLIEAHSLIRFPEPIAPCTAAKRAGIPITFEQLTRMCRALPNTDWRIYEGAGGLAVPLDVQGHDWTDLAKALGVEQTILVIENRLGAINQGRLLWHYAQSKGLQAGLWLNEITPQSQLIKESNQSELIQTGCQLFGQLGHNEWDPICFPPFLSAIESPALTTQ